MSHQYRVVWRTRRKDPGAELVTKLRYADRKSPTSAHRVADSLRARAEDDYCECVGDGFECGYCDGTELAPTDIKIIRRQVGEWEAVAAEAGA